MPNTPNNPNSNNNVDNSAELISNRTPAQRGQVVIGAEIQSKYNNMDLEQLLALDVSNLSYEELQAMQIRLAEERRIVESNIATLREEANLSYADGADTAQTDPTQTHIAQPDQPGQVIHIAMPQPGQSQFDQPNPIPIRTNQADSTQINHPPIGTAQPQPQSNPNPNPGTSSNHPLPPTAANSANSTPEDTAVNREQINSVANKAKDKPSFKQYLKGKVFRVAATTLAALSLFGFASRAFAPNRDNKKNTQNPHVIERQMAQATGQQLVDTALGIAGDSVQDDKAEKAEVGAFRRNGYDLPGMWLDENKSGPFAFANAEEVAKICNNNPREMVKYVAHNASEPFADYLANLPTFVQPNGFKGLSITEAEEKLDTLNDKEYADLLEQFDNVIDSATIDYITVNGKHNNAYMRRIDESKSAISEKNMELVQCQTDEHDRVVARLSWANEETDEKGSMLLKMAPEYDKEGKIIGFHNDCIQAITPEGEERAIYGGLKEIKEKHYSEKEYKEKVIEVDGETHIEEDSTEIKHKEEIDIPDSSGNESTGKENTDISTGNESTGNESTGNETTKDISTGNESTGNEGTDTTEEELEKKNEQAQKENAGERVDQRKLDEEVTPKTDEEKDKENIEADKKQREEEAKKAEQAEQERKEQAEKEKEAAKEAEERRQKEEEERANKAAEEKEKEAERQRKADEAREKEEREAAEKQRAEEKAEKQRAEEKAERERAEREAEHEKEEREKESESKEDNKAEDKAEEFEEGDF